MFAYQPSSAGKGRFAFLVFSLSLDFDQRFMFVWERNLMMPTRALYGECVFTLVTFFSPCSFLLLCPHPRHWALDRTEERRRRRRRTKSSDQRWKWSEKCLTRISAHERRDSVQGWSHLSSKPANAHSTMSPLRSSNWHVPFICPYREGWFNDLVGPLLSLWFLRLTARNHHAGHRRYSSCCRRQKARSSRN